MHLTIYNARGNSLFQVTDSTGHVLYKKEDATKGKFAFTTDDYDMYKVCVESEGKNQW